MPRTKFQGIIFGIIMSYSMAIGMEVYNIAVKKRGDNITFLRRIVPGCADGSYGIEVAKLAGVPSSVVERAKAVLKEIEEQQGVPVSVYPDSVPSSEPDQLSFASGGEQSIREKLREIDINTLTPIEAMQTLYDLISMAGE